MLSTTITARSSEDDCSEAMTITCTATTVPNVFATPTITWLFSGDSVTDSGNPRMDPTTGQLIFDDIISENSGVYTCRASLTIPKAFTEDHYNETTREITTTSMLMLYFLLDVMSNIHTCRAWSSSECQMYGNFVINSFTLLGGAYGNW